MTTNPLEITDKYMEELIERASAAQLSVSGELKEHVKAGNLKLKGFRYDLNPRRVGRIDAGLSKQHAARALHWEGLCSKAANDMRDRMIAIRKAKEELDRFRKVLNNVTKRAVEAIDEIEHHRTQFIESSERLGHCRTQECLESNCKRRPAMARKKKTNKKVAAKKSRKSAAAEGGESIAELLAQLEASDDQDEKRRLRAKLRSRGHTGGANRRAAATTAKGKNGKAKKATKKKRSRRAAAA